MKRLQKKTRNILAFALAAVLLVSAAGCGKSADTNAATETETAAGSETSVNVVGEGSRQFGFTVVEKEGKETEFEVHTDKETVGEALLELDLIAGEDGEYGLYVTTVNGITVDFDTDGVYWAFYINDEYAQSGVDATPIEEGANYSFRVE